MRAVIAGLAAAAALLAAGTLPAAAASTDFLAPITACPDSARTGSTPAAERRALVCLVNWARARGGLTPVAEHAALSRSASAKADAIVSCGDFSHSPCGDASTATAVRAGYPFRFWAENLFWGNQSAVTPRAAMRAWLLSPPHRKNLFVAAARDLGVGRVRTPSFAGAHDVSIWVLQLGRR